MSRLLVDKQIALLSLRISLASYYQSQQHGVLLSLLRAALGTFAPGENESAQRGSLLSLTDKY